MWRHAHFSSCIKLPAPFVALCALKIHMRCLLITVSRFYYVGVNGNSFHTIQMCFDRNGAFILSSESFFASLKTDLPFFRTMKCLFFSFKRVFVYGFISSLFFVPPSLLSFGSFHSLFLILLSTELGHFF